MLIANLQYLLNILVLVGYLVFADHRSAWPEQFILWAWLPTIAHLACHKFAFGLQNTTYNIARIYLMRTHGLQYDRRLVVPIQTALIPDSMLPATILWIVIHLTSFVVLLFFQGWATAVCTEIAVLTLGSLVPVNHRGNLKRIHKQAVNMSSEERLPLTMCGVSVDDLECLVNQAIQNQIHPGRWWAQTVHELIAEKVQISVTSNASYANSEPAPGAGSAARMANIKEEADHD